jgi:PPM family protein phosphatase
MRKNSKSRVTEDDNLAVMVDADTDDVSLQGMPEKTQDLDQSALLAGWKEMEDSVPTLFAKLVVGAKSDLGSVRENNEDKFDMLEPFEPGILAIKGRFFGVADGMGGHSAGQIASEVALKTLMRAYYADPRSEIQRSLRDAVSRANLAVYDDAQTLPERQGMGTTLTAAVVHEDKLHLIHVGDSRAYLCRDGELRQVTNDHSWVAEQVRLGAMTLDDALASPLRNIILRSVGTADTIEPDYFIEDIKAGDTVLICSDGLTAHLDDSDLLRFASGDSVDTIGPSVAALRMVELANSRGGRDNITLIVFKVNSIEPFRQS